MSKRRTHNPPSSPTITDQLAAVAWPAWARVGVPLAIFLIVFVAFIPALLGEFLHWDDDKNFIDNPFWRGLGWPQVTWMFQSFHQGHYQPLTWLTLGLDYQLWGHDVQRNLRPFGYHLTNNVLHAINAVLLYWLAIRLIVAGRGQTIGGNPRRMVLAAGFAALFFGVHPLRVESVAWITERRDLVSGLLILLTMLAYTAYVARDAGRRKGWYALVLALLVMSLMGKVIGVTIPIVMLVLDWYPLRRISSWNWRSMGPVVIEKIPMLAIAAVFGAVVTHFDRERGWLISLADHPLSARLAQAAYGLVFYVWKTLAPVNLVPLYEMDRSMNLLHGVYLTCGLFVLVTIIILALMRRRIPAVVAAAMAYAILLGPTLGLVQTGPQLVADRYSYLSCMGWAIVGGAMLLRACQWKPAIGRAAMVIAAGWIVALGVAAWQQSRVWMDDYTLWQYACARKNVVSTYSWSKYGLLLRERGDLHAAEAALRRCIEIRPEFSAAHMWLGNVYKTMGRPNEALAEYVIAIKLDPQAFEPMYNYGYVLMTQNRLREAAEALSKATQRTPADAPRLNRSLADAHGNLGLVLLQLNSPDEAAEHLRIAKILDPSRAHVLDEVEKEYKRTH